MGVALIIVACNIPVKENDFPAVAQTKKHFTLPFPPALESHISDFSKDTSHFPFLQRLNRGKCEVSFEKSEICDSSAGGKGSVKCLLRSQRYAIQALESHISDFSKDTSHFPFLQRLNRISLTSQKTLHTSLSSSAGGKGSVKCLLRSQRYAIQALEEREV